MLYRWIRLRCGLAVGLLATAAAVAGPRPLIAAGEESLKAPLTAEAFMDAVLAQNASLEAMRQAVVASLAQV